ncbi:MAG: DUF3488 domain-containing transglutaminase family protein [Gammaproteobacteria bacterium]|nr:DUF3488 domain-containing transglutaminase family protein [Gammaproteobacteria bacterium]
MKHPPQNLHQRLRRANHPRLWLLAGLALSFIPHLPRLPLLIIAPSVALLVWRLAHELALVALPGRFVRGLLTVLALAITFTAYHTLFGREAGVGLLVVMSCLKLMEMQQPRDITVVVGLGYFVVATVFLFDQSILIGLYMMLVVVVLTTALTAFNRGTAQPPRWLNLRQAGQMLLQAAPIALLLFLLFPRIPGPLWNLPDDSTAAGTGLSDSMSPGKISQLSNNNAVAFRVQFDTKPPPATLRYWRGPVFTYFDSKTWSNPDHQRRPGAPYQQPGFRAAGTATDYTVTLEPHQQRWLFALDLPSRLPLRSTLSREFELISKSPVYQLRRYDMQSYTDYQLDPASPPDQFRYLQLPNNAAPRARQLARQWRNRFANDADIMQQALQYFRQQPFYYTRKPPLMPGDPVDEFLFDRQRGFCEHYASAFVVLMRAARIPARVVTGYLGGETNPLGDYFIVRQSDAHAWAEVWLSGQGWVRVDPTAVIPPSRVEDSQDLQRIAPEAALTLAPPGWATRAWRQLGFGVDNMNHYWNQWIINYNDQQQMALLSGLFSYLGLKNIDWRDMVGVLAGGVTLVLVALALPLLRFRRRRRDAITAIYTRFCRKLARRGLSRNPAEGPQDFALRAILALPGNASAIVDISRRYQQLRYAPRPPTDGLRHFRSAVRRFRP